MKEQGLKQKIRKYLGTAIVGAGLALGLVDSGYATQESTPPFVLPSTKEYERRIEKFIGMDAKRKEVNSNVLEKLVKQIEMANKSFYEGIKDKMYTEREQERTRSYFKDIVHGDARNIFSKIDSPERDIYHLLEKNLYNGDLGVVELQKYLAKKGCSIRVENPINQTEKELNGCFMLPLVLAGVTVMMMLSYKKGEK